MAPPDAISNSESASWSALTPPRHTDQLLDPQALVEWYTQYAVPLRPQPGLLVLSIIVSILGSYATLLCLGQRTGSRGWRNYISLSASALCFVGRVFVPCRNAKLTRLLQSVVSIWSMHFVSMLSIRLRASDEIVWYLQVCSQPYTSAF